MKKIVILLAGMAVIAACSGAKETPEQGGGNSGGGNTNSPVPTPTPSLTLQSGVDTKPVLGPEGGTVEIAFTASDKWTAGIVNNRASDWLTVLPSSGTAGSGKVTISAKPNDSPDERNATVRIACGTAAQSIVLTQKQKDAFTATSTKAEFGKEGGLFTIQVKSNIDFDYSIDTGGAWITYVETKALKTCDITFSISSNEDVTRREGQITVSSSAGKESFRIYQEGDSPALLLTDNTVSVQQAGGTVTVEVKSNVDVSAAVQEGIAWVTEVSSKAMSTHTWTFAVAENDSNDSRTAEIYFTNVENNLSETVRIVQAQKNAIVIAQDNYDIETDGGEIQVSVSYNVEFDVSMDVDWIQRNADTKAMTTETLVFTVAENITGVQRTGTITFTAGELEQTIRVNQAYEPPVEPEGPGVYGVGGLRYAFTPETDQLIIAGRALSRKYCIITPSTNRFLIIEPMDQSLYVLEEMIGMISENPELLKDPDFMEEFNNKEVLFTLTQSINTSLSPVIKDIRARLQKWDKNCFWFMDDKNKYIVIKYKY